MNLIKQSPPVVERAGLRIAIRSREKKTMMNAEMRDSGSQASAKSVLSLNPNPLKRRK